MLAEDDRKTLEHGAVPIPEEIAKHAHVGAAKYRKMYAASVADAETFWAKQGERLDWMTPYGRAKNTSFSWPDVSIRWFEEGTLNVSANCVDRHLAERGDQTAILWEPDDPAEAARHISYRELHAEVGRMANVLKGLGVGKGDRVVIYLPMIPEAAFAMLACARIGAIHSIVFAGFSPDALANRINDCDARVVITSDEAPRGGKVTALKTNVNKALLHCPHDVKCLVVRRTGGQVAWEAGRDHWLHELAADVSSDCAPEPMAAEDPLFILYTSGSTGKPKGVVHTSGGYLLFAAMTHELVFDYHPGEVFWCSADVGWVTGHTYIVYGPLANGATTLMFEGVPTWPDASRFWQVCEKHKVNIFYTAPTAIRALMGQGREWVDKCDLSSLRILGSVGEPINPEAWKWYDEVVGHGRCPIVDTWWQTETGGALITPLPGAIAAKPGSATLPFFGVQPVVLDPQTGEEITDDRGGGRAGHPRQLARARCAPSGATTPASPRPISASTRATYFTGDGCRRDADGYYWITGRVDDVINVSGHRMGTAEVESALVAHEKVSEAAVVGYPHPLKGQGIYCYVTLMQGETPSDALKTELRNWVRTEIGPIASPDVIQWAPGLPKTRSGKIMRRILRKIAENDFGALGDISTLAEPAVVEELIANRMNRD